jgi:hypothetical protein
MIPEAGVPMPHPLRCPPARNHPGSGKLCRESSRRPPCTDRTCHALPPACHIARRRGTPTLHRSAMLCSPRKFATVKQDLLQDFVIHPAEGPLR